MSQSKSASWITPALWVLTGVSLAGLLIARTIYPEILAFTILCGALAVIGLGGLIQQNRRALATRSLAYGVHSTMTILLTFGIVVVLCFLNFRFPFKYDFTKNKLHTLSDQTVKLVKGLKQPLKATYFGNASEKETSRGLLDRYRNLNPKFELEFVDPTRELTRTRQAKIRQRGYLTTCLQRT